ncbi:MAG: Ig-like domain-containing protein [Verrucomicrobia bacterium]|nr:Ig-like domain-containing protein [Verrucomicrobiota bacterium]
MFHKPRFSFKALAIAALIWYCANELPGGTLTGTFADIAAGADINLSAAGPLDWVHWGLYTETSLDRKTGVTPLISDFTALYPTNETNAFVFVYQFGDNANGYSWSDGTPTTSVTNTTTGVWAYGTPQIGTGFEITVPADTNIRTLKVYVGAYAAKGQFEASLSDGSATAYSNSSLSNVRSGQSAVYAIEYAANSAGQTLTIRWKLNTFFDPSGNVTLQSAALTAVGANNPPIVSITSPTNNATYTAGANITINADASDLDGSVTKVEFYDGANKLGEDMTGSPYSFTWNNVPAGYHVLTAVATDNQADFSYSQPVEIFVNTSGGSLSGSNAVPPGAVNLTSEGTADWSHWGLVASNSFDHKSVVTQKISDFTVLGTNAAQQYSNNYTVFSWSDGTPTASATDTPTGVFITGVGNGFKIIAPADTTPRRLKIYAGLYGAKGNFQAYLSDFSAQAYTDTSVSNVYGDNYVVYTLDYSAASSGQSLIVQYRSLFLYDQDFGNVTLQSATLQGGASDALPVTITNPMKTGSDFVFSFLTQSGHNYIVEYADALPASTWGTVTNLPGTGATVSVTNLNVGSGQRFYRVQTQ